MEEAAGCMASRQQAGGCGGIRFAPPTDMFKTIMFHWRSLLIMSFALDKILNQFAVSRWTSRPSANGCKHLCAAIQCKQTGQRQTIVGIALVAMQHFIHHQALCETVTIACMIPNSASSVILVTVYGDIERCEVKSTQHTHAMHPPTVANSSRLCLRHHSVDSGMLLGEAVPKIRVNGSESVALDAVRRPKCLRRLFMLKSCVISRRFKLQKPYIALRRKKDCIWHRRFCVWC